MANRSDYSATSIKTTRGMEGSGYSAFITRGGKKVAEAIDYANGGPLDLEWLDTKVPRVIGTFRDYKDEIQTRSMTPEEKLFNEMVFALPQYQSKYDEAGKLSYHSADVVIEDIVNDVLSAKRLTNLLKNKTVFITTDKKCMTLKGIDAAAVAYVEKKYPTAQILNKMEFAAALKLAIEVSAV